MVRLAGESCPGLSLASHCLLSPWLSPGSGLQGLNVGIQVLPLIYLPSSPNGLRDWGEFVSPQQTFVLLLPQAPLGPLFSIHWQWMRQWWPTCCSPLIPTPELCSQVALCPSTYQPLLVYVTMHIGNISKDKNELIN